MPSSPTPSPLRWTDRIGAVPCGLSTPSAPIIADPSRLPDGIIPIPSWNLIQEDDHPPTVVPEPTDANRQAPKDEDLGGTHGVPATSAAADPNAVIVELCCFCLFIWCLMLSSCSLRHLLALSRRQRLVAMTCRPQRPLPNRLIALLPKRQCLLLSNWHLPLSTWERPQMLQFLLSAPP